MNSVADGSSMQCVRDHNWVIAPSSVTERRSSAFYIYSPCGQPLAPLSLILTLLSLVTYFFRSLTLLKHRFLFISSSAFTSTVAVLSSTHSLIATSPPWVRKTSSPLHYHPKRLLRPLSSSEVTYPKPAVMNLNTACLWSHYHNAYFSEISSSFSTTLWSLSRSEPQKLLQELKIGQVKRRTGELCNPLWMTQHNIIPLLLMF